jgi:inhibitor of KinA sporulation pathway (predicted exonuclease)
MNPIPREFRAERGVARAEIIEIGAVRLDREYELCGRYSEYVKPIYGVLSAQITKLTGIKEKDLADAAPIEQRLNEFADWIGGGHVRIYSWSRSDLWQLGNECRLKQITLPSQLRSRWMDFQSVYTRLIGLSTSNPLSLKNAIGAVETRFEGEVHRAVHDAENSAMLLKMVKKGDFSERTKTVRAAVKPIEASAPAIGAGGAAVLAGLLERMKNGN